MKNKEKIMGKRKYERLSISEEELDSLIMSTYGVNYVDEFYDPMLIYGECITTDDYVARLSKKPSQKRTLVSVNEIRGKVFNRVTRDDNGIQLSNDTEFYKVCYTSSESEHERDPVIRGDLSVLENAPLSVEKISIKVKEDYVLGKDASATALTEEVYELSTKFGSVMVHADWFSDGLHQFPGNLIFIKCGSREDTYIRHFVDLVSYDLPLADCRYGFNDVQKEIENREWRGVFADFRIWEDPPPRSDYQKMMDAAWKAYDIEFDRKRELTGPVIVD